MKILSMRATFGRLQNETLTLAPGLNILELPNETGKSTWCAFLLAMLYGVDTSERETRTNFPAKKHYAPWSGSAMEGQLVLEHEGRRITIERSSTSRAPLGIFRAFDAESGLPIEGLNAQNCGQQLLGIPRQVFERSAFVRQDGAAVTMDATLEQRLGALVSSGDETLSYQQAERQLRERRNRCRHNRTGLIPATQTELDQVNEKLARLDALHATIAASSAQLQQLRAQVRVTRLQLNALQVRQAEERRSQLAQVSAEASARIEQARQLERACAGLPSVDAMQAWERELRDLQAQQHTLSLDLASLPQPDAAPEVPAPFAGLDADAIVRKANVDGAQMRLLQAHRRPSPVGWIAAAVLLAALAAVLFWKLGAVPAAFAGAAVLLAALAGSIVHLGAQRRWRADRAALDALTESYGVDSPEALDALAERCRDAYGSWQSALAAHERELAELHARRKALDASTAAFAARLAPALGQTEPFSALPEKLADAIALQLESESAHRSAEQSYRHYCALKEAIGTLPRRTGTEVPVPEGKTLSGLQAELTALESELSRVQCTLSRAEGQSSTLGDRMELSARREQLEARLAEYEREYMALSIAIEALGKANEHLQNQFSPQLTALAGEYLDRLTDGSYTRLVLARDLGASLYPDGAPASREAAYFSGGTRDQLYLAVRLAVSRLLAPAAPLILDDALVRFDDRRLQSALALLQEESAHRQILLFTCQTRESHAMEAGTEAE